MRLPAALILGLAAQLALAADPVGRIFYTPEQRTQLDALRTKKTVASQVRDEPVPETVTYNGIVRRSDGKTTVWLNDEALSEASLLGKQSVAGRVGRDGKITLQAPQAPIELKVGQSATLFSGKVEESFATKNAPADKVKATGPAEAKPAATTPPKDIPPELLEALRQAAAARAREHNANPPAAAETPDPAAKR